MQEVLLIIFLTIMNILLNIVKKDVMNGMEIKPSSIIFWIKFFLHPTIIGILILTLLLFALSMWLIKLIPLSKMTLWNWIMTLVGFFLTLLLSHIIFKETININVGFWLVVLSLILGMMGIYLW